MNASLPELSDGEESPDFVYRSFLAGRFVPAGRVVELSSPGEEGHRRRAAFVDAAAADEAAAAAASAREACAALSRRRRSAVLTHLADSLELCADAIARSLTREIGKALAHSSGEVQRTVSTLRAAAHDITGLVGAEVAVDAVGVGEGYRAFTAYEPVGVVAGICGFNFPLLLAAHKIAGAIGAGAPIILKPSERTPFSSLVLGPLLVEAGWPAAAVSILNGSAEVGDRLIEHPEVAMVSFTGSARVGAAIAAKAGALLKRTALELGSNAATVIAEDADLPAAIEACAAGIVASSGQSCISVQRIIAHASIARRVAEGVAERLDAMPVGYGIDPEVAVGRLVSPDEEARVAGIVRDALDRGAGLATGREPDGATPALLVDAPTDSRIAVEEAFGPIAAVFPYSTDEEAIEIVNSVEYGLMTGVFTDSLERAMRMASSIRSGGVHINSASTFRPDNMPYGGVKMSGIGREGPACTMREYSIEKVVTVKL